MATKKNKAKKTQAEDDVLTSTAVAIGSAIGSLVAKSGLAAAPVPAQPTVRAGKLSKKPKQRLPRKAKKQLVKTQKASTKPRS
jgi:hypothetical protein